MGFFDFSDCNLKFCLKHTMSRKYWLVNVFSIMLYIILYGFSRFFFPALTEIKYMKCRHSWFRLVDFNWATELLIDKLLFCNKPCMKYWFNVGCHRSRSRRFRRLYANNQSLWRPSIHQIIYHIYFIQKGESSAPQSSSLSLTSIELMHFRTNLIFET